MSAFESWKLKDQIVFLIQEFQGFAAIVGRPGRKG
jgi:hypothetical protein